LASPKTTLAWLLQAVGAPSFFLGIIVPLRESGSLIPQLMIAAFIRAMPIRKWIWCLGSLLQAIAIGGIGASAVCLEGVAAGWSIVGLLTLFSLSRGMCSVASKDILGKTIPKTRRGRLKGWQSSAGGFLAIGAGSLMVLQAFRDTAEDSISHFGLLLFTAAALWVLATIVYAFLREFPGATEGGDNAIAEAFRQLTILKDDSAFRNFVLIRALAIGSGLSAPFIVSIAHGRLGGAVYWLGVFIIMDGLAGMLSAPILGVIADKDSRELLRKAMLSTFALLLLVIGISQVELPQFANWVLFPCIFFVLGVIHSGVRLGRKTYLIDMAEGNKRTAYVAVSNTLIGLILLVTGALTGLIALLSVEAALLIFALCALTGWWIGKALPQVSG
jgi:hypothetical protein